MKVAADELITDHAGKMNKKKNQGRSTLSKYGEYLKAKDIEKEHGQCYR
jgi:hypothetical protein